MYKSLCTCLLLFILSRHLRVELLDHIHFLKFIFTFLKKTDELCCGINVWFLSNLYFEILTHKVMYFEMESLVEPL